MNAAQQQAVMHAYGPAMVLAGPGSGKTFVIAHRLKVLIEHHSVDPAQILVITFTRASAVEMQIRFLKLTDSSYPEVSFGTFHSIFYQIILNSLSDKNSRPEIADTKFQFELIRDILSSLKQKGRIGAEEYEEGLLQISDILSEISRVKNLGLLPSECSESFMFKAVFEEIFRSYKQKLREFKKIDFDDMMERCYELLSDNRSILEACQKRYRFIMIDEYQDINPIQSKVVELLLGEEENLFAVGDDDQSIYGFRGSDPGIMLDFRNRYRNAKVINLNVNYRSGSSVIDASQLVIKENKSRYAKELKASEGNGQGRVLARRYDSRQKQNDAIALFLDKHRNELSDIAILYRTNSECRNLLATLQEHDIPSNLDCYRENIYRNKAVETLLAYLRFAYEGHRRSDFLKIVNVPMRYISRDAATSETVSEKEILAYYKGNPQRQRSVKSFFRVIDMISHMRPSLSVRYLRRSAGIDKHFKDAAEALDRLEKAAQNFDKTQKFLEYAREEAEKEEDNADKRNYTHNNNRVNLLTMHGSKGLEFKIVWLPDLNEGIIPSRSATSGSETEEERRMLYVAMTRAKQALIMSYIKGTKENPMLPSRFLRPIRQLWDENYRDKGHTSSEPSSGSSTSSSNSASSR